MWPAIRVLDTTKNRHNEESSVVRRFSKMSDPEEKMSENENNQMEEKSVDEKPAKKLSPLEAKKQLQAQLRQGLQRKAKGVSAVRDESAGGTGSSSDAPPPRQNTPRRAGGS